MLLGGLITLAVTALVQIVIIPWVQVHTRRRERWEKDVIELDTLLRWEFPRLLADAKWRGQEVRSLGKYDEASSPEFEAAEKAADKLFDQARRVRVLENRVRLERRKSGFWLRMGQLVGDAAASVIEAGACFTLEVSRLPAERWQDVWLEAEERLRLATELLSQIAIPMVPPPTNVIQRWLFSQRIARLGAAKKAPKKAIRRAP